MTVIEDAEYKAIWTPAEETEYKVEHYLENLEDDEYTLKETEALAGTTGEEVTPEVKDFGDFTKPATQTVTVEADGSTVVKYYYDRPEYDVTFDENGGSTATDYTDVKSGTEITVPTTEKEGFVFGGWEKVTGTVENPDGTMTVIEDAEYKAIWTPAEDTKYIVNHYQQNIENDGYTLKDTEPFTGTTGEEVTPGVKDYDGFTKPEVKKVTVAADGSTVVDYYYDRLLYDVTFDENGGSAATDYTDVKSGTEIKVPTTEKEGFVFGGWKLVEGSQDVAGDKLKVTENATYEAIWIPAENTKYVVNHHKQNLENDEYQLAQTQKFTDVTDSSVTPDVMDYDGFTKPEAQTVMVKADGTTVVDYYYECIPYDVTSDTNDDLPATDYTDNKTATEIEVPTTEKVDTVENSDIPVTGDDTNLLMYILLAILALGGAVLTAKKE